KERGSAPGAEANVLERAGNPTPRPILDVHNVKERGATGTVVMCKRSPGQEHAHTRTRPGHTDGFWMFCGSCCGPFAPPAYAAEGRCPAPVIPVSLSSLVRADY